MANKELVGLTVAVTETVGNHVGILSLDGAIIRNTDGILGEPAVAGVTGDVTTLVQDVTETGVVRVVVVAADGSSAGEVSGDSGVSAAVDAAVAFDHAADEAIAGGGVRRTGSAIGQSGGTGSGRGGAGGADEDSIVGQEVIGTEDFKTFPTITIGQVGTGGETTLTGRTAGELVIEAGAVQLHSGTDLFQVAGAVDATGAFTGLLQSGQQHAGQDRDDRDDDEELDQSKSTTFFHFLILSICFLLMTSASDFVSVQQCSSLTVLIIVKISPSARGGVKFF